MANDLDEMIASIAHRNRVTTEEVRRELLAAMALAFKELPARERMERLMARATEASAIEEFKYACVRLSKVLLDIGRAIELQKRLERWFGE